MPGQGNAALSVTVRVGSDRDPLGKEQMAHYLEHMQFSDHLGLSTREIKKQIEDQGGVFNGSTGADRTFYYVHIKKDNALFALDWLYRVISPHEMKPDVVERERYPVEVEVGAKPREIMDWVDAVYVNPPYLRPPGAWKREFGIQTTEARDFYTYRSLRSITPRELRQFYDRHYSPARMTLTVIGDLDRDAVLGLVNGTFATLRQAQEPPAAPTATDAGRSRSTFFWDARSNISYTRRIRFASMTARDELMLTFIGRFLGKRLNDRLRFGEQKAVYGISTGLVKVRASRLFPDRRNHPRDGVRVRPARHRRRNRSAAPGQPRRRGLRSREIRPGSTTARVQLHAGSVGDLGRVYLRQSRAAPRFSGRDLRIPGSQPGRGRGVRLGTLPARARVQYHDRTDSRIPADAGGDRCGLALWDGTGDAVDVTRPVDMTRIRYVAHLRIPKLLYLMAGAALASRRRPVASVC